MTLIEIVVSGFGGFKSEPPPPPKVFKADHPFLFLIKHNPTNTITFIGRFVKP